MIRKHTKYTLCCDICHSEYTEDAYDVERYLIEDASADGWQSSNNGKWHCPCCKERIDSAQEYIMVQNE